MYAGPTLPKTHHAKYLIALALLLALTGGAVAIRASAPGVAATVGGAPAPASSTAMTCAPGDVFELNAPGTYTAFAITSTGALPTHVRGPHGQVLATTHPFAYNTAPVDLASASRFDIAPPPIFETTSNVMIHVEGQGAPYELVIVRLGEDGVGDIDIWPPVERVFNESGSCLVGDLREYFRIRTDSVYSDPDARQSYMISLGDGT